MMKTLWRSMTCALRTWAAVAMLAGCAESTQLAPMQSPAQNATGAARVNPASWMDPQAGSSALLYVADSGKNAVYVYSFPDGKLMGTLSGFDVPQGECVDGTGNVWITNQSASEIREYAHGGTKPIATLKDPNEYPDSCSVDAKTGDLAVTNGFSSSGGGSIGIYSGAKGSPTKHTDSSIQEYSFVFYDDNGDLFVDGAHSDGSFALAKLPKGGSKFANITLTRVRRPGALAWDTSELAIGDADPFRQGLLIYHLTDGKPTGHTQLSDTCGALDDFALYGDRVVALDPSCQTAAIFSYPGGGSPTKEIKLAPKGAAVGVVVSP
jgi:hypothetical protein